MIRVLIADDHTIVRHGIKQIIDADEQLETVCEADNGNDVLRFVKTIQVDVVVLDITLPGRNGLETLKELRHYHPSICVIVLSMHPRDQYAVRVLRAGAYAYITKESAPEELVNAIKKAYNREKYISPEVAALLADYVERGAAGEPHKLLSDREYEVFGMLASGKTVTEISDDLSLSVKTISTYRTRIIEKTGLTSNAEFNRYCLDHGILR